MSPLPPVEIPALDASCLRVHRFSPRKTLHLLALLAASLPATLPAAVTNYVWDGNATGNSRWSRVGNWTVTNSAPPASVDSGLTNTDITFAGALKTSPLMDNNYFIRTLNFSSSAASFTLASQGATTLSIGLGGINNFSTNKQTIVSTLSVSNSQTWNAAAGNLDILGVVNLGSTNRLSFAGAYNTALSNMIQGTGGLIMQGPSTLTLAGTTPNTFSGGITLQSGTLIAAKTNALGTGALTLIGGTLNIGSFNQTVSSFTLQGGSLLATSGSLSSGSAFQILAGNITSRLGGTGGLYKTTAGIATLSAANTYSGGTFVTGGTLFVNNTTGSGTGTGNVSVSSGGLLAGTGSISGIVTNGAGGTISAGNPIGVLNLVSSIWLGGSTNRWDINSATGSAGLNWDLLNLTGSLTINATTNNKAFIDISSFTLGGLPGLAANFNPTNSYLWTILTASGGINFALGENASSVLELLTGNFINPQTGGRFGLAVSVDGRNLNVTYTPTAVPEPSGWSILSLAACGIIYGRRFNRNWSSSDKKY